MKHELKKITMKRFEEMFGTHYPDGVKSKYHENSLVDGEPAVNSMWLYYDKDDKDVTYRGCDDVSKLTDAELHERINKGPNHVGTWHSGGGWLNLEGDRN